MPGLLEIAVHRGDVVAALDQLDLQRPGIGEGHRIVRLVARAPVHVVLDRHPLVIEKRAYAEHPRPVVHRRLDVVDDIPRLPDLAEKPAHRRSS